MSGFQFSDLFFEGVVEDVNDPKQRGRIRVRVIGVHPPQKQKSSAIGVPTEDLPWMTPVQDITSAAISGVGSAPVGIVPGTMVFGVWRDPYKQDGRILGTMSGEYKEKPDPNKGFADPLGFYPTRLGSDSSTLSDGGEAGKNNMNVVLRDDNSTIAVNPDNTNLEDIPEDNDPNFTIEKMMRGDEGVMTKWYSDHLGYPTIGIGHLLSMEKTKDMTKINAWISRDVGRTVTNGTITLDEVSMVFRRDLKKHLNAMKIHPVIGPIYEKLNASRKMALTNMCLQMGVGGVAKFKNTLKCMDRGDWVNAYRNMKESLWASQTKGRASRVSKVILTGNLESYGVMVGSEPKSLRMRSAAFKQNRDISDINPEEPFTPEDTRIMFTEPKSSYDAQYPYNYTRTTRSGHVIEIDDTPGSERLHTKHTSGTFDEIRPDGSRVLKIVGDSYEIVLSDKNLNIKGNINVVIEGNANIYNMGNVSQTIDGDVFQYIRGNVVEHVEGALQSTIDKTANITVKDDVFVTAEKNASVDVGENASITVAETTDITSKNMNINIEEDLKINAGNTYITSRDTTKIDSGVLTEITGGTVVVR